MDILETICRILQNSPSNYHTMDALRYLVMGIDANLNGVKIGGGAVSWTG